MRAELSAACQVAVSEGEAAVAGTSTHVEVPTTSRHAADVVPVLLFHGVDETGDAWSVTPSRFREHLDLVAACGREAVTVGELSARMRAGAALAGLVAVSFDDGDASQLTAAGELAEAGIPSSVYVTIERIGRPGFLSEDGVRELDAVPGVEVGSHSVRHLHLDLLPPVVLRAELHDSRTALEHLLARPVTSVAYPHGSHNRRVVRAAAEAGYVSGAAVRNALAHGGEDPLAVSRLTVTMATPLSEVRAFLRGEGRRGETRPRLRTRGFRYYRSARYRLGR